MKKSRPAIGSSRTAPAFSGTAVAVWGLACALGSAAAVLFFSSRGWLLLAGDAEAHLDIARRILDSRTPGYEQVGTVWLPLTHWLMLPFVGVDAWWRNGLAGAIPAAAAFVAGTCFLFAAVRRIFQSAVAGLTAAALCALNPNLLYLQATPMTETLFFACLCAMLFFTVRFRDTQGWPSVIGAGLAACAGTLTRYEGWFLIPFVGAYFLLASRNRRLAKTLVFCLLAALGPLFWLAHNWWLCSDPLDFYHGPYSAHAIQGNVPYPGRGNWRTAFVFFRSAAQLCAGGGLVFTALGGILAALWKRALWPLIFLALPAVFIVWSVYSGATPIFVPGLYRSYYNARYGLAALPLLAVCAAALTAIPPRRLQLPIMCLVLAAGTVHWAVQRGPQYWPVWQEPFHNDGPRRQAVEEAAAYLKQHYVRGTGIFTSFGAIAGIYRMADIPLRDTFTVDNYDGLMWNAAVRRPDLFLREPWAVARAGDMAEAAIHRAGCYRLENKIFVKGGPAIEIYRRAEAIHGTN